MLTVRPTTKLFLAQSSYHNSVDSPLLEWILLVLGLRVPLPAPHCEKNTVINCGHYVISNTFPPKRLSTSMPSSTQCPAVSTTWGAIREAPHTYTFTSSESASVPPMLPTSTCRAGHVSHYGARDSNNVHLHDDRAHVRPLSEPRLANIGLLCGELYSKVIID